MSGMPRPRRPHLNREKTRHGNFVWYVRVGKGPRRRLNAEYGSAQFNAEYDAAVVGAPPPELTARTKAGSLQWLYDRYRDSTAWADLSAATRRQRENIFVHVMETAKHEPYAAISRRIVEQGKDRRKATPAQARNFLDAMRGLFRWAKEAQHVKADPTEGVKNPTRKKTEGFKAWDEAEIVKYEARWGPGTRQRVWLHVLLYIGARRGDAMVLGKQHVKNGVLTFTTEKGREKERIEVTRRIEPELAATLAQGPCGDLAFICGERGNPLTKESFGNDFKGACVEAGIPDKSAHGVRKLSATIWAERGATEHELMAMYGWLTPQMAALYTRKARRKLLALNAHDRLGSGSMIGHNGGPTLPIGTPDEHSIPAPSYEVRAAGQKTE